MGDYYPRKLAMLRHPNLSHYGMGQSICSFAVQGIVFLCREDSYMQRLIHFATPNGKGVYYSD